MYAACILHVSRMSPSYQIRRSLDAFEIHVSHDVFQVYPACILITSADTCIPNVSQMYLACILHLSYVPHWIYSRYAFQIVSRMYPVQDTCIVILYLGVSWCILMKSPRDTRIYMYPVWHQGSAQDTCILMYLMCIPKCILDSFGIRVKYMQNIKIHVFSWNITGHLKYILRYIRIHKGYMYPSEYMQDTCKIHEDTSGYVSDRKPPPKRIGNPPAPGTGHARPAATRRVVPVALPFN